MVILGRIINFIIALIMCNFALISLMLSPMLLRIFIILVIIFAFTMINISPRQGKKIFGHWNVLIGGYELLIITTMCFITMTASVIFVGIYKSFPATVLIVNALGALLPLFVMSVNAVIRIFTTSKQLRILMKVLLITLWWLPIVNLIIIIKCCRIIRREYMEECLRITRFEERKEEQICKTKYPILLIHGIFFRDWKGFNYWGRIPAELERNGATLYYGNQESSASIHFCAVEIKNRITEIMQNENCKKINIIAHSKGGLDARYALCNLGIEDYVASLTTVNTPHRGCKFTDSIFRGVIGGAVAPVAKGYNAAFKMLGDSSPDFYHGVHELTYANCTELNQVLTDSDKVFYQSVGSKMSKSSSAFFPLNFCYKAIKKLEGDNDGLVATESMRWGDYRGTVSTKCKRGVSHADMIDLTRRTIPGFDIREYYIGLVSDLKDKGF